jgi:hypothetical protein
VDRQHIVVDSFAICGEPEATLSRFQVAMNSPDTQDCTLRNCMIVNPRDPVKDLHSKTTLRAFALDADSARRAYDGRSCHNVADLGFAAAAVRSHGLG